MTTIRANCCALALVLILSARTMAVPLSYGPVNEQVVIGEYAEIVYVNTNADTDRAGQGTREAPFTQIEAALKQLDDCSAEHRGAVLVARGTYQVDPIQMKSHVDLFGGFDPENWSRDIEKSITELTPMADRRLVIGADSTRLDGFVLKGAHGKEMGGAILCDGTSPSITNNLFIENRTIRGSEAIDAATQHQQGAGGGAICCVAASPFVMQNSFYGNSTDFGDGGAIFCASYAHPRIRKNLFCNNRSGTKDPQTRSSNGGAIACTHYSNPHVAHNVFVSNHAMGRGDGGAIYGEYSSEPIIEANVFVHNSAEDDGAAAYFMSAAKPKIRRNTFAGNGPGGGVVRISKNGSAHLEANRIIGNPTNGLISRSGFLVSVNNVICENAGSGLAGEKSVITSRNDTICNHPQQGVATTDGSTRLVNGLIAGNRVQQVNLNTEDIWVRQCLLANPDDSEQAEPKFATTSSLSADRNTFVEESPQFESDNMEFQARVNDTQPMETRLETVTSLKAPSSLAGRPIQWGERWSVVKSADATGITVWGTSEDDASVAASDGRLVQCYVPRTYHVTANSPSIDRGVSLGSPLTDVDGDPRPQYPQGLHPVDIGADEFTTGRSQR